MSSKAHSPAEILREALVDVKEGMLPSKYKGGNNSWPIFVGHLPEEPDNAVCIYDTTGVRDGRIQESGENIDHPGFQVRVRGKDHPTAYKKIKEIQDAITLFSMTEAVIGIYTYKIHSATRTGTIISLGQEVDRKRRAEFTLNGILTITEET